MSRQYVGDLGRHFFFEDASSVGLSRPEFEARMKSEPEREKLRLDKVLPKYALVSIYLKDGRRLLNVVLFGNAHVLGHYRVVEVGQTARDRISDFSVCAKPRLRHKFRFQFSDIVCLEEQKGFMQSKIRTKYKFLRVFSTSRLRKKGDVQTRADAYSSLPKNRINLLLVGA